MLHTVNKSPFADNTLDICLKHAKPGSAVLLIEDGVYGATQGTTVSQRLLDALATVAIYALKPDVEARGMQHRLMDGIKLVDYGGFVGLVVEHHTVQSWL